jgi:hypothetical protein
LSGPRTEAASSTASAGITTATGYDPLTGEQVEGPGRLLAGAVFAVPFLGKIVGAAATAWREAGIVASAERDAGTLVPRSATHVCLTETREVVL